MRREGRSQPRHTHSLARTRESTTTRGIVRWACDKHDTGSAGGRNQPTGAVEAAEAGGGLAGEGSAWSCGARRWGAAPLKWRERRGSVGVGRLGGGGRAGGGRCRPVRWVVPGRAGAADAGPRWRRARAARIDRVRGAPIGEDVLRATPREGRLWARGRLAAPRKRRRARRGW